MKNLMVRALSGAILAVVVLGAVVWSPWSFGALLAVLLVTGLHEFYTLCERQGIRPQRVGGTVAGLALFLLAAVARASHLGIPGRVAGVLYGLLALLVLLAVPLILISELYRRNDNPAASVGTTVLGVLYVALPLAMMFWIPSLGGEAWFPGTMVAYIFIIWANDVFAYLVGMSVGRRKFFERISPKKSWEGFFGGLIGAVLVGMAAAWLLDEPLWAWAGLALVAAVTGVLGDLTESMLKRSAGVKDSGRLIPGHGGVLDRFDAMLLSAPFVFVYLYLVM